MTKILAASNGFVNLSMKKEPGAILRKTGFQIDLNEKGKPYTEEELLAIIDDYEAIVVGTEPMTKRVIEKGKKLKIIAKNGVGYDNIDVNAASENGIFVTIAPGVNQNSVAEGAIALMLALSKNITLGNATIRKGLWKRTIGRDLYHKKLGLVGLGRIGQRVALLAKAFGMEIYAYDPFIDHDFCQVNGIEIMEMDQLLMTCDYVSLHLPLNDQTRNFIDAKKLSLMKSDSFLINTARGGLVDESALYQALKEKRISGAAIDVYSQEPPPADFKLFELDNVVLTPHNAGYSEEIIIQTGFLVVESLITALNNEIPPNSLNAADLVHHK